MGAPSVRAGIAYVGPGSRSTGEMGGGSTWAFEVLCLGLFSFALNHYGMEMKYFYDGDDFVISTSNSIGQSEMN